MQALTFHGDTMLEDFAALNARFDAAFGYPNEQGTVTYAAPILYPDVRINSCAMIIEDRCLPLLSPTDINNLQDFDVLLASGWAPTKP